MKEVQVGNLKQYDEKTAARIVALKMGELFGLNRNDAIILSALIYKGAINNKKAKLEDVGSLINDAFSTLLVGLSNNDEEVKLFEKILQETKIK